MKKTLLFLNFLTIWSIAVFGQKTTKDQQKPNIIFFIADDMLPNMFNTRPEGKGKNLTPNLDRLANEGVFLTGLKVASPVCTPSRYNCLTGNYASRATNKEFLEDFEANKGQTVIQWNSFITPGKEKTIGNYLQELGYKTGFVGKNHAIESLSQIDQNVKPDLLADPNNPTVKAGLEERHRLLQEDIKKSGFDFADNLYHDNPSWLGIKALASQNMDWITEGGLRFLDTYANNPFFLYFATTLPHHPLNPENSFDADPRITAKGYLEQPLNVLPSRQSLKDRIQKAGLKGNDKINLLWMDDALGALFKKLEDTKQIDNTIIVFFNDHGQLAKGTLYQGGIQSQGLIWKKGGFQCGNTLDTTVTNVDFLPTLLELAGASKIDKNIDGQSFKKALDGKKIKKAKVTYHELGYARGIVKNNYKYMAIRYPKEADHYTLEQRAQLLKEYTEFRLSFGAEQVNSDPSKPYGHLEMVPGGGSAEKAIYGKKPGFFDRDQLYDLENDPKEENNLANNPKYAKVLKSMKKELQKKLNQLPGHFNL